MDNFNLSAWGAVTIVSLLGVWIGSNLIINSIDKFSRKLHASSFLISFFFLGFLTSTTEMVIAINAYVDKELYISVGNLLGGIIVIFLLLIPALALVENGIRLEHKFTKLDLFLCLVLLTLPGFLLLDDVLKKRESLMLLAVTFIVSLLLVISNKMHINKQVIGRLHDKHVLLLATLAITGTVILIYACNILLEQTTSIASYLGVSPFVISLLGLSLGTNFPEISIAVKSVLGGKKDIAFGNYLGSAVYNVIILAILGIINNRIYIDVEYLSVLFFTVLGLSLFYVFVLSKDKLSRMEGVILLVVYTLFVGIEIFGTNYL